MLADETGIDLGSVTTEVSIRREADLTTFEYAMALDGVTETEAATLRDAASRCPVRRTLSKQVAFEAVGGGVDEAPEPDGSRRGPVQFWSDRASRGTGHGNCGAVGPTGVFE